jgi:Iap family predicted aminopeptidase
MYTRQAPAGVVDALSAAGAQRRTKVVVRRLVPGILTDGVALADAGWPTVTVSRATMGTLSRVHTTNDTAEGMSAVGISEAAALIADAMMRLHGREG